VRAVTIVSKGGVAIMTEHAEPWRETIPFQPSAHVNRFCSADSLSVCIAPTTNMVDGEKLQMRHSTTCTTWRGATIRFKGLKPQTTGISSACLEDQIAIIDHDANCDTICNTIAIHQADYGPYGSNRAWRERGLCKMLLANPPPRVSGTSNDVWLRVPPTCRRGPVEVRQQHLCNARMSLVH